MQQPKNVRMKSENLMMKKFINDPANLTVELLDGLQQCYPNQIKLVSDRIVVRATPKSQDKVAIVTLGGTGHGDRRRRREGGTCH